MTYQHIYTKHFPVAPVILRDPATRQAYYLAIQREERLAHAAPEVASFVRKARDYLSGIPETAAGGDDEAVALTRKLTALLTRIDGAA